MPFPARAPGRLYLPPCIFLFPRRAGVSPDRVQKVVLSLNKWHLRSLSDRCIPKKQSGSLGSGQNPDMAGAHWLELR